MFRVDAAATSAPGGVGARDVATRGFEAQRAGHGWPREADERRAAQDAQPERPRGTTSRAPTPPDAEVGRPHG